MADISSANAKLFMSFADVFTAPQQIQGWSADDIFGTDDVDVAETMIGLDGVMSSGYIFYLTPWSVTLQADSASNIIFETVLAKQKSAEKLFPATASILLPSVSRQYAMTNGVLKRLKQMPDAKKVLQPRRYTFDWQDISPAPYAP